MHSAHHSKKRSSVSELATLDGFLKATAQTSGVGMHELEEGTCLRVQTANTAYRIWVADTRRREVFILGGRFFPSATRAVLSGSTVGGSLMKESWIGLGMRLEVHRNAQAIITSPVARIVVEAKASVVE